MNSLGRVWGTGRKEGQGSHTSLPFERVIKILHEEGERLEIRSVLKKCQRL